MSEKMEARIAEMQAELKAAMQLLDDSREKVADAGKRLSCELRYHAGLEAERQLLASGLGDPEGVLRKVTDERDQQQAWIEDLRKAIREAESVLDRASIPGGAEVTLAVRVQRGVDLFRKDLQRAVTELQAIARQRDAAVAERDAERAVVVNLREILERERGVSEERWQILCAIARHAGASSLDDKGLPGVVAGVVARLKETEQQRVAAEARILELHDHIKLSEEKLAHALREKGNVTANMNMFCDEANELRRKAREFELQCDQLRGERDTAVQDLDRVRGALSAAGVSPNADLVGRIQMLAAREAPKGPFLCEEDSYKWGLAQGVKACVAALRDRVAKAPQPGFEAPQHSTAVMLDCAAYLEREVKSV